MQTCRLVYTLKAIADFILPRQCAVCSRNLLVFERFLCTFCMADIPYTYTWNLRYNPMSEKFNSIIQEKMYQKVDKPYINQHFIHAASLFFFNSEAGFRHIPYMIKYHGDYAMGVYFGRILGDRLAESPFFKNVDAVIPVPLHWWRKRTRGYNQAEAIARGISYSLGIKVLTSVIYRHRYTKTQTRLDISEKNRNVDMAFCARRNLPDDIRHVLIVDDVFTTGSTLFSCYKSFTETFPEVDVSIATLALVNNM